MQNSDDPFTTSFSNILIFKFLNKLPLYIANLNPKNDAGILLDFLKINLFCLYKSFDVLTAKILFKTQQLNLLNCLTNKLIYLPFLVTQPQGERSGELVLVLPPCG